MKTIPLIVLLALSASATGLSPQGSKGNAFAQIPFELVNDQVLVSVKIAGKGPFPMLLDTNTDPSAIDPATAKELGLAVGTQGYPASGGGTEVRTVHLTRLPLVELGIVVAKDVDAGVIDLTKLSEKLGRPIHGVLGYSFLKDRIVQIDYPESKIRIYDFTPYPNIQTAANTVNRIAVPFRYDNGVVIDNVFINGLKMRAALDTGSSGTFALTPQATQALNMEEELRDAPTEESVGYNGEAQSKVGVLKIVRIGRLSIDGARAVFWLPGTGHDSKKYDVNIGNGFFEDFIMTFDFHNKQVVFERQ